ncbi:MAG: indole acetimide hydrolase [Acidimicrobiaceae bacterium]|nr:indole acetimide hydrolase [Acidimicrobiaceae bacterium]|tara:strand:- start:2093 stop:3496 length:1404 start_codon:yes stop_codon:yes gene_type:complete
MGQEIWQRTATELAALIASGEASSREVVDAHLGRIDEVNGHCNAVVRVLVDEARAEADAADAAMAAGDDLGPFHGVPFTVKENLDVAGTPTTQGLPVFADLVAPTDAPIVERMRSAGGIPIGRTNLPELGLRVSTDNPLHGLTRNPWHPDLCAGGSSGGEGSAIATGMSPLGLGNDIGGSVRNPAFCCGITSLKPSHGRLPSFSAFEHDQNPPLSSQVMLTDGPMARSVADLRTALGVLHGRDPRDPRSVTVPLEGPEAPRRAAVVRQVPGIDLHPSAIDGVDRAADALAAAGWDVDDAVPPELERCSDIWAHLLANDIGVLMEAARPILSDELGALLDGMAAEYSTEALAPTVVQAEYMRLAREWGLFFVDLPVLVMPAWTQPPFPHGADLSGDVEMAELSELLRCIIPGNVLALPVVAVPVGVSDGLPLGVQCYADRWREDLCLSAAGDIEAALGAITPIDPITG